MACYTKMRFLLVSWCPDCICCSHICQTGFPVSQLALVSLVWLHTNLDIVRLCDRCSVRMFCIYGLLPPLSCHCCSIWGVRLYHPWMMMPSTHWWHHHVLRWCTWDDAPPDMHCKKSFRCVILKVCFNGPGVRLAHVESWVGQLYTLVRVQWSDTPEALLHDDTTFVNNYTKC